MASPARTTSRTWPCWSARSPAPCSRPSAGSQPVPACASPSAWPRDRLQPALRDGRGARAHQSGQAATPPSCEPAGPLDERVWTLCALPPRPGAPDSRRRPPRHRPLAALVNFALHPAIAGGTEIVGDFPAALEETPCRPSCGGAPGPVVVFANAPCGDINHVDVSHDRAQSGTVEARRVGTVLGAAAGASACRLVADWEPDAGADVRLRGASATVDLPLRRPSDGGDRPRPPGHRQRDPDDHGPRRGPGGGRGPPHRRPRRPLDGRPTTARRCRPSPSATDLAIVGPPRRGLRRAGARPAPPLPLPPHPRLRPGNEAIGYVPTRPGLRRRGLRAHLQPPPARRGRAPGRSRPRPPDPPPGGRPMRQQQHEG